MELPAPGGNGPGRLASAHRDACRARRSAREDGESSAGTRRWAGTDGPDAERWPRIGGPSSSPTGWPLTEPARTGRRRRTAAIDTADSHTGRAPAHPDLSGEKHGHQRGTQRRRRRTGAHAARPAKEQDRLVEAGTARAAGPQTHPDPPAKAQPAIEAAHGDSGRATNPPGPAGEGTAGHRGRARRQRRGRDTGAARTEDGHGRAVSGRSARPDGLAQRATPAVHAGTALCEDPGMAEEVPRDPLPALRRLCLALPETTERLSHGEPAWFVRDKKTFVSDSQPVQYAHACSRQAVRALPAEEQGRAHRPGLGQCRRAGADRPGRL